MRRAQAGAHVMGRRARPVPRPILTKIIVPIFNAGKFKAGCRDVGSGTPRSRRRRPWDLDDDGDGYRGRAGLKAALEKTAGPVGVQADGDVGGLDVHPAATAARRGQRVRRDLRPSNPRPDGGHRVRGTATEARATGGQASSSRPPAGTSSLPRSTRTPAAPSS